ncbi:TIGR03943 family putative permease subunit [Streptomyces collinus]|uniref:TIGR03943 family putative permease subunit n=1 Tax=Streptomyces collinus TaxID=42684 RepID=UPI0037ACE81D
MRRYGPAVLLALVGAAILRVSLFSELYLRYVQAGLRPYLVVSGAALVLLGVAVAVMTNRADEEHGDGDGDDHGAGDDHGDGDGDDHGDDHGDGHGNGDGHAGHGHGPGGHGHGPGGPRVAWFLTLPALALLLFPPPALGSYSAEREAAQRAARGVGTFPALPSGNPVDLTLGEFGSRAVYDSGRSLKGRTVRLTGFVTRGGDGTWYVTRLLVSCCAADATSAKAEVRGAQAPPVDTWVTVTGTWHPEGGLGSDAAWPPVVDARSVRQVPQPDSPYEKR